MRCFALVKIAHSFVLSLARAIRCAWRISRYRASGLLGGRCVFLEQDPAYCILAALDSPLEPDQF
jgi:hypothetical protein